MDRRASCSKLSWGPKLYFHSDTFHSCSTITPNKSVTTIVARPRRPILQGSQGNSLETKTPLKSTGKRLIWSRFSRPWDTPGFTSSSRWTSSSCSWSTISINTQWRIQKSKLMLTTESIRRISWSNIWLKIRTARTHRRLRWTSKFSNKFSRVKPIHCRATSMPATYSSPLISLKITIRTTAKMIALLSLIFLVL